MSTLQFTVNNTGVRTATDEPCVPFQLTRVDLWACCFVLCEFTVFPALPAPRLFCIQRSLLRACPTRLPAPARPGSVGNVVLLADSGCPRGVSTAVTGRRTGVGQSGHSSAADHRHPAHGPRLCGGIAIVLDSGRQVYHPDRLSRSKSDLIKLALWIGV